LAELRVVEKVLQLGLWQAQAALLSTLTGSENGGDRPDIDQAIITGIAKKPPQRRRIPQGSRRVSRIYNGNSRKRELIRGRAGLPCFGLPQSFPTLLNVKSIYKNMFTGATETL